MKRQKGSALLKSLLLSSLVVFLSGLVACSSQEAPQDVGTTEQKLCAPSGGVLLTEYNFRINQCSNGACNASKYDWRARSICQKMGWGSGVAHQTGCTSTCYLKWSPKCTGCGTDHSRYNASGSYSSSYGPQNAFDKKNGTLWISKVYQAPAWLSVNYGYWLTFKTYTIRFSNGCSLRTRAPKNWKLQGWLGGDDWETIDTRNNQTNWPCSGSRTYTIQDPGRYTRYRLYVTHDNDSRSNIVVVSIDGLSFGH